MDMKDKALGPVFDKVGEHIAGLVPKANPQTNEKIGGREVRDSFDGSNAYGEREHILALHRRELDFRIQEIERRERLHRERQLELFWYIFKWVAASTAIGVGVGLATGLGVRHLLVRNNN